MAWWILTKIKTLLLLSGGPIHAYKSLYLHCAPKEGEPCFSELKSIDNIDTNSRKIKFQSNSFKVCGAGS